MADYTEKVDFLTINEFKTQTGTTKMEVLKNPNTGKLFLACDNGQNFKVQADIDGQAEMKFLIPKEGLEQACLVNVGPGAEVVFSL